MATANDGIRALRVHALAAGHRAKVVVPEVAENCTAPHQRRRVFVLCAALQVPELDVAIADRHKVAAVVAEADRDHLGAHLIRGDLYV